MAFKYDLTLIENKKQLLTFLGMDNEAFDLVTSFNPVQIERVLASDEFSFCQFAPFYRHLIPKRDLSKGMRVVWEVNSLFDRQYKAAARRLEAFFSFVEETYPHPNAFGYIRGRNIRQNAARHLNKRHILKCDIRDFFGTIETIRVADLFVSYGVKKEVADLLAGFLTIGETLPLGLPTSPIITNILCIALDIALTSLSEESGANYTRYADDMTFSSDEDLPSIDNIDQIVRSNGFQLAGHKTRRTKIGQAHYVTGLSVSDPSAPHAPRKMKRNLRQTLHYAKKFGLIDHFSKTGVPGIAYQAEINKIDGMVKYVSHQEPKMAATLYAQWKEILNQGNFGPSFEPKNQNSVSVHMLGDETEFEFGGKTYLALCLCVTQYFDSIAPIALRTLRNHLADPLADGDLEQIRKNGLHFSDATEDLRKLFVSIMQNMPFNAYVAVASLSDNESYQETYLRLIRSLIRRRLIASDGHHAFIYLEATDKVSGNAISNEIDDAYQQLKAENNRRPVFYEYKPVSKEYIGIALPDFLLGVLRRYLLIQPQRTTNRHQRAEILFEYVRDKLVVLLDLDQATEYSRRNPVCPWDERLRV